MRSTALRTASAPAPSVLACGFSTYSPEKSGFTSAVKTRLRQRKGTSLYQIKLTVGGSLGFFNKLLRRRTLSQLEAQRVLPIAHLLVFHGSFVDDPIRSFP